MKNSSISLTDHTFNPWCGCTKVSSGCQYCYAEKTSNRNPRALGFWGADGTRNVTSPSYWADPIRWNAAVESNGIRTKVFCGSMCDVFEGPGTVNSTAYLGMEEARTGLFNLIDATPNLDWLLLTKRPENILKTWEGGFRPNIWLGTTVECQDLTWRIDALREARNLVPVLFISSEPLVGPVEADFSEIDWLIVGGESGAKSKTRKMEMQRALELIAQAHITKGPCFYKQHGVLLANELVEGGVGADRSLWKATDIWNVREFPEGASR